MSSTISVQSPALNVRAAPTGWRAALKGGRRLWSNPLTLLGLFILALLVVSAILAPVLAPVDPTTMRLGMRLRPPGPQALFGTDELGRDIFSRVVYGSRVSLQIGTIVIGIAATIGFTVGAASGYFRGAFDGVVMRLMDIILAFPPLVLAMAIASFLGPDLNNAMLAIAVVHIPKYTRLARSEALALRESLFVTAAQSVGASHGRIILRHIMPNALASILVVASLDFGLVILTAASLGFIGLGAQPPTPEWGLMVADGRKYLINAPWVATFPGLAIVFAVIAANVFGDGLRDVLDPRLRT